MRVAHLIQYFHVGGLERMVLSLARGARAWGYEPVVAAYVQDGSFAGVLRNAGIETALFAGPDGLRRDLPTKLWTWLRTERIDLLHTHHVGPFLYGAPAAIARRLPVVHTEHSREFYDQPRLRWVGSRMERWAEVVCVSDELTAWRHAQFGPGARTIVNGVDVPPADASAANRARRLLSLDADAPVVGFVGRLAPEKDPVRAVLAFAQLRAANPAARLVIVGDGSESDAVRAAVASLELDGSVQLAGRRDDVEALYPAFDLLVLPSRREGLPLAMLEAMARGVPVVATPVGAIPHVLNRAGGQAVAAVGDRLDPRHDAAWSQALGGALVAWMSDPARRLRAGAEGRQLVEAEYSVRAMVAAYVALYDRSLERRRRRS